MTTPAVCRRLPRAACATAVLCLALLCAGAAHALGLPLRAVQFPPEWVSRTIVDCEEEVGWQPVGDPGSLVDAYATWVLAQAPEARAAGQASCRWEVQPRPGAPLSAELRSNAGRIPRARAFSVWIKNPSALPATLGLKLVDADGAAYLSPPVSLGAERNWYELAFPVEDLVLEAGAQDPRPGPTFPARSLGIVLRDLRPGLRYLLYLDELRAHAPAPPRLDVIELVTPRELPSGEAAPLRFRLRAQSPVTESFNVRVALCLAGVVACAGVFPVHVPAEGLAPGALLPRVEGSLRTPTLLTAGTYQVTLDSDRATIEVPGRDRLATTEVRIVRPDAAPTTSAVETILGRPTITARGLPLQALTSLPQVGNLPRGLTAGSAQAPALHMRVVVGGREDQVPSVSWPSRDRFVFTELDEDLACALSAAPNARVLLEVQISCPDWWAQAHPEELSVLMREDGTRMRDTVPSFSSTLWRDDAAAALTAVIRHLEGGPVADHILGYQVSSGLEGRWLSWDVVRRGMADYSAPQREAFQEWVRDKYRSLENYRSAWGQPAQPVGGRRNAVPAVMRWVEVPIPTVAQRSRGRAWLLDPAASMPVVDYRLFSSSAILDTLDYLLETARNATAQQKVCGAAYGHIMELAARHRGLEQGGHLALVPALQLAHLDFLVGPPAGGHPGAVLMPVSSIHHAGKVLLPDPRGLATDPLESVAAALEQGLPVCLPNGGVAPEPGPWPRNLDTSSVAEIAVVVDDFSAAYFGHGNPVKKALLTQQMDEVRRMGAPVNVWLLEDLLRRRVPPHRMYLFLNAFRIGVPETQQLLEALPGAGETVVWLCAPGAIGHTFNGRQMMGLTGIATSVSMSPPAMIVKLTMPVGLLEDQLPAPISYGVPAALGPQFQVIDTKVDVLGVNERGEPALVRKYLGSRTSIYSVAPNLPADLLRALARSAGVRIYGERGDRLYVNKSLVAIRADTGGRRVIRLPGRGDVTLWPDGELLAADTDEVVVDMAAGETKLLVLGSGHAPPPPTAAG